MSAFDNQQVPKGDRGHCRYCGSEYELDRTGRVVTHDYPKPCRRVCPGSKEPAFIPGTYFFTCESCGCRFQYWQSSPGTLPEACPFCSTIPSQ